MTSISEREKLVAWIQEAQANGARLRVACTEVEISERTYRRWYRNGEVQADRRPLAQRPTPAHALTQEEKEKILETCSRPEFASLPPSQIVPRLADMGVFIASESSFYRVLREFEQVNHRGRAKAPATRGGPPTHTATKPNELWAWDITYLASQVRGQYFYLYMVEDIFSRKCVAWEVYNAESGDYAAELIQRAVIREQCFHKPLILHSDNGSPMKSQTLQAKLSELKITPSHSRPRVSNDNAFAESLFRTLKYAPQWPPKGFSTIEEARGWVETFMAWYNNEHRHSAINFVTPVQRHQGEDIAILKNRANVYQEAKANMPSRWSGEIRNWSPAGSVTLNPINEDASTCREAA